ncbi:SigE family RNA polymerase sigma factor [Nocardioides speluncae]|uniref:SigE family RNA polymerase sigma factor n=1 Tax=Nocardioides speluncae TaxID=2670337 RepID=UPI000D6915DF|nr:SigE family RNA polymerase sigma factor [Nocardioides speluncae]
MPRPPNEADFSEFVHASWPSLYRTAYLMLGEHALAEDLVQTSLAKTYASWRHIRELAAAPAYARKVMFNTAASWFRQRGWRNELPTLSLPERGYDVEHADRPTIIGTLRQLPPRQRAVVVLRYYEDLSVADAAAALGCTEGTVKSQTADALAKLRTLLGDAVAPIIEGHPS